MDKETYVVTDMSSGYSFQMELTHNEYLLINDLKYELGYVMEDIQIEKV